MCGSSVYELIGKYRFSEEMLLLALHAQRQWTKQKEEMMNTLTETCGPFSGPSIRGGFAAFVPGSGDKERETSETVGCQFLPLSPSKTSSF